MSETTAPPVAEIPTPTGPDIATASDEHVRLEALMIARDLALSPETAVAAEGDLVAVIAAAGDIAQFIRPGSSAPNHDKEATDGQ